MPTASLVYIDETSIDTGRTRFYGRAPSNERVIDHTPDVRFERTTLLSSVRTDGTIVPMIFDGSLNGELFVRYIADFLAPTLKPGDLVIMDNLSSHKVSGVLEAFKDTGASVRYLPPYSPDLNPIEKMWSKIKAYLRKRKARDIDALEKALAEALDTVSRSDILAWVRECGYSI